MLWMNMLDKYKAAKNNIEQNSEIIQKTLREKTQKEAASSSRN